MLAMVVNAHAGILDKRGVSEIIASMLAPTGGVVWNEKAPGAFRLRGLFCATQITPGLQFPALAASGSHPPTAARVPGSSRRSGGRQAA
ncbi:hypothetical protein F6476_03340 [Pseudomonas umsongensis]|uniref:Uncharacterized protein n=1 Tax=Pseudomonas umsongensis TaxID=198618 RepID=A0ABX4DW23_9PSED|nr:hypothetical protein PSUM_12800 [Pseudomonas umsongensis]QFG28285.1 hypothetical protein F6476_03340 [Pseudomonas umsongensis]